MATPGTEIIELETGVFARLHEGLTNAGIIVGDDSVLIIDSLRVPSFARDLIKDVKDITDKPIQFVIDTHSHWDHSWGNEEFPDATIIGHKNCYAEMIDVEWNEQWRKKVTSSNDPWSEEGNIVNITPPNMTFETSMQLYFGGRELDLKYFGRAHTSGDIYIHLPKEKIVFTGDVAQDGGVPYLGDCYPVDWPDTDNKLAALPIERFMSGHGPIGDHKALEGARDFIHNLVDSVKSAIADGQNSVQASESVIAQLTPEYGNWRSFDRIGENLTSVYEKLKV
ncbi:MAG: MBL fold metallo-hydrolase [SAR202 cluster bacterium]|jgi:glyoxylase-like metal-dependent hydrolase (beta-lactamase superfamily II)|nr:MAG: MBL fold metallo-hydrolase [SAR202 cluster bacterium]KAA1301087.1 MAG: MBL fold metallo-hydrolase [SAR202 cluster bacterium]MEC7837011.1 MBL fold metallo-hydrolase [Chloroflexota bacterium]|tara:strand:- start:1193 stop:2035 length:843 start_codon:yes stop_codon:yes gene_type:complete